MPLTGASYPRFSGFISCIPVAEAPARVAIAGRLRRDVDNAQHPRTLRWHSARQMSAGQLAAMSYLAHCSGRTHAWSPSSRPPTWVRIAAARVAGHRLRGGLFRSKEDEASWNG
jgi:hypothetical protein